jgi:branched-chain amino acid aminotransferase
MGSERGTGGPTLLVAVTAPAPVPTGNGAVVAVVPWTRNERGALAGLKTTSYGENVVALARARSVGAGEALLANTAGHLCEGTGSNVFVVDDDVLVTPPLRSGCLAGITRELLLEAMERTGTPVVERDLPLDVLGRCPAAALTSSTRDVQAIATIVLDDGPRPLDVDHPLIVGARRAWAEAHGPGGSIDP